MSYLDVIKQLISRPTLRTAHMQAILNEMQSTEFNNQQVESYQNQQRETQNVQTRIANQTRENANSYLDTKFFNKHEC